MQEVKFISLVEYREPLFRPNVFTLRKDRKHVWLQKAALYILTRLGCYWIDETVTVKRIEINADKFMERLYKQKAELFQHFTRSESKTLLIGAEDYAEMMETPGIYQMLSFHAEAHRSDRGYQSIMGLEVKIVPWMRGMVVMT